CRWSMSAAPAASASASISADNQRRTNMVQGFGPAGLTVGGPGVPDVSLIVNTIGTCMCVFTSPPPLRPGLNFHWLTASTAAASNAGCDDFAAGTFCAAPFAATTKSVSDHATPDSRCDDFTANAFCTLPSLLTMKSTVTSPLMPARRISTGY